MTQIKISSDTTCPFCGATKVIAYQQHIDSNWILHCKNCDLAFSENPPAVIPTQASASLLQNLGIIALVNLIGSSGDLLDMNQAGTTFVELARLAGFTAITASEINKGQTYDVITAWNTLQNSLSLKSSLQDLKCMLKPDGLFFFELPCLLFDEQDNYWFSSAPRQHYYFTEKSLHTILEMTFGSSYIGRTVKSLAGGCSIVGFVSPSQPDMNRLQPINQYLRWIIPLDLPGIANDKLVNYLVFYLSYLNDIDTAQLLAEHLIKHPAEGGTLYDQYLATLALHYLENYRQLQRYQGNEEYLLLELAERFARDWHDQQAFKEAKDFHLSQINYRDIEIENLNKIIKQEQELIARQENQLGELARLKEIAQQYAHLKQHNAELYAHLKQHNAELLATIAEKNHNLLVKDQALADQAYQIWIRDVHIQNLSSSKLYRLKEALVTDPISLRKFVRIAYIMAALLTPGPVKKPIRPLVSLLKQALIKPAIPQLAPVEPVVETIEQQPWPAGKPLVSVVIPCYNYGEYLLEAIDSVLNQTFKNIEIIVVDDGSTEPHTLRVLEQLDKPKTRLLRQKNQGVVRTRNNGIRQAQGKYICCLDADDLLHPTYLEKCVIKLESENADVCYPWLQEFGDGDMLYRTAAFEIEKLMQENVVVVVAVFKKSMWQQVGGFKGSDYEDWEFWLSIAEAGGIGTRINEPLFLYRKHGYSRLDSAIERHQHNIAEIQRLHRRLYKYPQEVEKAKQRQHRRFRVKKPYVNLTESQHLTLPHTAPQVLLALPFTIVGGGDRVLLHTIKALTQFRGFKFSVITTVPLLEEEEQRLGTTTPEYEKFTDEIYHLPKFLGEEQWKDFIFYLLESRKIEVIYQAGSIFMYKLLPDIKRRYPHIKVIDQMFNAYGHIENNRKYARYLDHIVSDNDAVKEILVERYKEAPERVSVVHTGVDTAYYQREEAENSLVFDRHPQVPRGKFIISYLGRLSEEKWPELFVEIARHFKQDERVHFVLGGNGPLFDTVRDLIAKYDLGDKIYLPGFIDSRQFLNISNLLILPSKIDGWPNIILESLSMNVPAIVSNVGGLRWMIKNGFNGFLCEVGEKAQFIEAIEKLLNNRDLYMEMCQNAREYAASNLNITKMYEGYIQVFDDLLDMPSKVL